MKTKPCPADKLHFGDMVDLNPTAKPKFMVVCTGSDGVTTLDCFPGVDPYDPKFVWTWVTEGTVSLVFFRDEP